MKNKITGTTALAAAFLLTAAGFSSYPESRSTEKSIQAGTVSETEATEVTTSAPVVTDTTRRTVKALTTEIGLSDPRKLIYPVTGTFNAFISIGEWEVDSNGNPVFYNIENVDCYLVKMENGNIIKEYASWNTSEEPQKTIKDLDFSFENKNDFEYYTVLMDNLPDDYYYEPGLYGISYSTTDLMYGLTYKTDGMIEPVKITAEPVTETTTLPAVTEYTPSSSVYYEDTDSTTLETMIHADYATRTEYDDSPMKIGETRAVRFWNPENMSSNLQYFWDYSHNFDYSYEEGSDTIYITAKEAGIISAGILAGTAFSGSINLTVTDESYEQKIKGDITGDGITDLTDLTEISLYLLKDREFSDDDIKSADTDNDGKITLADLARIKQYVSNQITSI